MSSANASGLQQRFAALESLQSEIIRKAQPFISANQPMHTEHFYVFGIVKRTLAQASAFRSLVEARNFPCAAAIVRLQIDSAMRLNALRLVSDRAGFCKEWLGGK